jgi:hypothetical protein
MPTDAYTVRAVVEPGRSMDNEAMPRGVLVGFLRGLADGLEDNPDAELVRLTVSAAPGSRSVGDRARELYDGLAVEDLQPEIAALEQVPRGAAGCTCGTPPFAPPEPSADCPHHGGDDGR